MCLENELQACFAVTKYGAIAGGKPYGGGENVLHTDQKFDAGGGRGLANR